MKTFAGNSNAHEISVLYFKINLKYSKTSWYNPEQSIIKLPEDKKNIQIQKTDKTCNLQKIDINNNLVWCAKKNCLTR